MALGSEVRGDGNCGFIMSSKTYAEPAMTSPETVTALSQPYLT